MVNTSRIHFAKSALTALYVMDESEQNRVLASVMRALSSELSTTNLKSTPFKGDESYYSLSIDNSFRVILKFDKEFILVKNIFTTEMIDFFQKAAISV
jgi:mRNA-degrading endonuclease RelE of RelBE toxin-antitoxin system